MSNITYQTKNIKIEKVLEVIKMVDGVVFTDRNPIQRSGEVVYATKYRAFAKLPIPYTFGLLKRWVSAPRSEETETLAMSTAATMIFKDKYDKSIAKAMRKRAEARKQREAKLESWQKQDELAVKERLGI